MSWQTDYQDVINDFRCGNWQKYYRIWSISKKNGKRRWIHAPQGRLKELQRILNKQLSQMEVHPAAYAFIPGGSHLKAVKQHRDSMNGRGWLLTADIKDFYGHVTGKLLSAARLSEEVIEMITVPHKRRGKVLPQGGVTSPIASNLALVNFDTIVNIEMVRQGLLYTRYADDIGISSTQEFNRHQIVDFIANQLRDLGLFLAPHKTKFMVPGGKQQYLGVFIDHGRQAVDKDYLNLVKSKLRELDTGETDQDRVLGMLSYIKQVNPIKGEKISKNINIKR